MADDTSISAEKFQQELNNTADKLTRYCENVQKQLLGHGLSVQRELQETTSLAEEQLSSAGARLVSSVVDERDELCRNADISRQSAIRSLVDYADALQKELQSRCSASNLEVQTGTREALEGLGMDIAASQGMLDELNRGFNASSRLCFDSATAKPVTNSEEPRANSEIVHEIMQAQQVVVQRVIERIDTAAALATTARAKLLASIEAQLVEQRSILEKDIPDSEFAAEKCEPPDLSDLDAIRKECRAENERLAKLLEELHESRLGSVLQELRSQSEQIAFKQRTGLLAVCGQLESKRTEAEEDYIAKLHLLVSRAQESLVTERASLQQVHG